MRGRSVDISEIPGYDVDQDILGYHCATPLVRENILGCEHIDVVHDLV